MITYLKKFFICLAAVLLTFSCFGFTCVQADEPQTCAYYINYSQFSGTSNSMVKNYDGNYMGIEAVATSSSGSSVLVTMYVFIYSRNYTYTYNIYTNGTTYKYDYIYLGDEGSSDVGILFTCNSSDTITVNIDSYSWTVN